jgi:hypothetical protein
MADADALLSYLVAHASEPRTKEEMEELLAKHLGGPPHKGVWWAMRTFAPLSAGGRISPTVLLG